MEKKTYPIYYRGELMPWAKGTVVKGARGLVWLSGTEGFDPHSLKMVEGAEAQSRMCWEKIKSGLEEMESSLDGLIQVTSWVVGPFPGGVADSPVWKTACEVREAFLSEHCPDLCAHRNPPTHDLIGVAALGHRDQVIEISVVAAVT